jgi:RimJ/RimL family protein N-acetyltransferase
MGAMTIGDTPGRTSRLTIEPLALAHSDALHRALDDPRVGEYIGGPDVTTSDASRRRAACWAAIAPQNTASARLLRRIGFEKAERAVVFLSYDDGDLTFRKRSPG